MEKKHIYFRTIKKHSDHVEVIKKTDDLKVISVEKYDINLQELLDLFNTNFFIRQENRKFKYKGEPNKIEPITKPEKIPTKYI